MVEPHISSVSGNFNIVAGSEGSFKGEVAGLRLGYLGDYFMAGMNFEKGSYSYDSTITEYGNHYFTGGGVGTYLGFHFLDHWRLWTDYLNSALEPVSHDSIRYFGQQVSLGISYRLFDGWMINYYQLNNYLTQYEDDVTGKTGGLSNNIRIVATGISLSFISVF